MRSILTVLAAALLIGAHACTTDDDAPPSSTSAPSSRPDAGRPSTSERPQVTLVDVGLSCGPTDAIVVTFEAVAEEPLSGRAELVALGETWGDVAVELGPTPTEHLMEINLTQEVYDAGDGMLRVTSDDGEVVATETVRLRLDPGIGCG